MNRIRDLREDRDMRQIDLAEATGIDQRTISNYETGKTSPDAYAILKLAEFFDVSTDYLLGKSKIKNYDKTELLGIIDEMSEDLARLRNEIEKL